LNPETNDVLAGTVCGVLPTNAPSYDVSIHASTDAGGARDNSMTILLNGNAVLERAIIPMGSLTNDGGPQVGIRHGAPLARSTAPAGSRLVVNLYGTAANTVRLYVEAVDRTGNASQPAIGAILRYPGNTSAINELDILQGTPVGSIPTTAFIWLLTIQAVKASTGGTYAGADADITLSVDTDTICENFVIPCRADGLFFDALRDTLISTLVSGGSRLRLNLRKAAAASGDLDTYLRIFATPIQ